MKRKLPMKKIITLVFVCFILSGTAWAQTFTVKGKVLEAGKTDPIPYANILLLTVSDSSQVAGTISDIDGEFEISGVRDGDYLFKVQLATNSHSISKLKKIIQFVKNILIDIY